MLDSNRKIGLPLPKNVRDAYVIDDEDASKDLPRLWQPVVNKEMNATMIAFQFVGNNKPVGYNIIRGHQIFDVKMDLTRKARFVAEGNLATPDPGVPAYASVVSRESVRILFAVASLHNLNV